MKLSAEIAYRTIDLIYAESGLKAVVCNLSGVIVAAVEKDRIGNIHSGACQILQEGLAEVTATLEDEERSGGLIRMGVHLPIIVGSEVVGTYGIGGEPSLVRSIARISVGLIRDDLYKEIIRQQILEQDQRFQILFDSMIEGVALHEVIVNEAGNAINYRIVGVNKSYEKNVGLKKKDICGKLADEAYGTPEPPFLDRFTTVALTGVPDSMEEYFEPLNKYFSISIVPWGHHRFATIFFDVSERKRMEKEIQLHSIELEATVEQRTQELFATNEELTAMNEEMTAMNEEMTAMNEELYATNEALSDANQKLTAKDETNQQLLAALVSQKSQLRATTELMTKNGEDIEALLKSILNSVQNLAKAQGAYVGLYDKARHLFTVRYASGVLEPVLYLSFPPEQGLFGQLLKSGEMIVTENYGTDARRHSDSRLDKLSTLVMIPLKVHGNIMGAFSIAWADTVHSISTDEMETLQQFCDLASLSFERAMTLDSLAEKNRLLEKLAKMTESLINDRDVDAMLQRVLEEAADLVGMRHGFIQLFDPEDGLLYHRYALGSYDGKVGTLVKISGITAKVLHSRQVVYVQDYHNWPERGRGGHLDEIKTAMQAPMMIDGKVTGMIGLSEMDRVVPVSQEQLAILEQYAHVAAIAIKNAQSHKKTTFMALHDSLTGLANRASLHQQLEQELEMSRCGCLMYIDLDDLKSVNDVFGHTAGDKFIVSAGDTIAEACGDGAFVARIGGDEFVVILSGENARSLIAATTGKLIDCLGREYEYMGQSFKIAASIGVTYYPDDADSVNDILRNADNAMYAAKTAGKNCWRFYEPAMQQEALNRVTMINSLRHSLEKGELYLHYQPQLSLADGRIVGFEALLRWQSAEHGAVSPVRFIPLAEHSGLILPIGRWVMDEACKFVNRLSELGRTDIHVAVNISPKQLSAEDFIENVRLSIESCGIEPCQIELEITENVLIDSLEDSIRKLGELKEFGVRLSLDDFGTGFSSLTYLRSLPVGTLKIDKRFVDDVGKNEQQDDFVRLIIDMARMMELNVVAEGVETDEQLRRLAEMNCNCIQGYVFSRAVSEEEALRLLQNMQ